MNETDFEGTLVLEQLAAIGLDLEAVGRTREGGGVMMLGLSF